MIREVAQSPRKKDQVKEKEMKALTKISDYPQS